MNQERRFFAGKLVELRTAGSGRSTTVRGYAAVFDSPSAVLRSSKGEFVEVIDPGFFDVVLEDDVMALFNHDQNLVLARSTRGHGTLRLFDDGKGLGYEFEPDARQSYAQDLLVALERRDVTGSSFGFTVRDGGDSWARRPDGMLVRHLLRGGAAQLFDVGPVTYPAYRDTEAEVSTRSLDRFLASSPASVPTVRRTPMRNYWCAVINGQLRAHNFRGETRCSP